MEEISSDDKQGDGGIGREEGCLKLLRVAFLNIKSVAGFNIFILSIQTGEAIG